MTDSTFYRGRGKRLLDILVGSAALALLAPLLLLLALLVWSFLGTPVLFRQQRSGRRKKPFTILKFRTMTSDCDANGVLLSDSQRLTRFGRFLRATSLDELPELLNVLKGEMSLVGPRPLLLQYDSYYSERESRRFELLPGITGWAQINGRNDLAWDDRLECDAHYVENCRLGMDLKILLLTVIKVLRRDNVEVDPGKTFGALDQERRHQEMECIMLVFIIPLKSAKISRDWTLASRLFERCARSICNQTSSNFRVVVICNERPAVQFNHPHLHYLEVDFPPPIPDLAEEKRIGYDDQITRSKNYARKEADKARKVRAGLDYARRFNPTYSMVVDADDCVSNRLAEFVARNSGAIGWYFKTGYLYTEGSKLLFLNRQHFNVICGSSVIVAYTHRDLLFSNPDFYQFCFYEPLQGLVPLPFPGAVYSMANGDNILMSAERYNSLLWMRIKRIFSTRIVSVFWKMIRNWPKLLTEAQRKEFGLYKLDEGPPAATAPVEKPAMASAMS